ncbi:hypothetical protein [uncultured Methanolobus sp.]|uniref:hypothetical protein n=1 Tax=uncultured Methanolobus sp. TaxID=218300 RepID=UPI002AAAD528|nr:hypothetical protein [uncultured Methanolobus sp.]
MAQYCVRRPVITDSQFPFDLRDGELYVNDIVGDVVCMECDKVVNEYSHPKKIT